MALPGLNVTGAESLSRCSIYAARVRTRIRLARNAWRATLSADPGTVYPLDEHHDKPVYAKLEVCSEPPG